MHEIIQNIGTGISILLGLLAIFWPLKVEKFVSIKGIGKEGKSEVRATYGGFFAGIAFYAMVTQNSVAFIALGIGWLSAAIVRLMTFPFGYITTKNIGGVVFEAVIGLLCISSILLT
jgi:hypothetical protein